MQLDTGFHALGYKSAVGLHPIFQTLNVSFRQTLASRAWTLCMHTDEPINRPFIPITHYRLMSDSMWADFSNNISFRPSLRNMCTSTSHTVQKMSCYFSYLWCITQT